MSKKTQPAHGGARAGAGLKAKDGATDLKRVNMMIRTTQREKLDRLGGSVWLRAMIDGAKDPK